MALKRWEKLSEKTVMKNSHWAYNIDEFLIGGGEIQEYHYVHTLGSTMVIPLTNEKKIIMVKQYRYLNQKESLEFPCGAVEQGLSFEENANKELREESGYKAGKLIYTGDFSPYTGASDEICKVYIGTDLINSPLQGDLTEEFEVVELTPEEIESMINEKIIWDGLTLSAWILSRNVIGDLTKL